jgi:hypothetical protein
MLQRDVVAELRSARLEAPEELRERVRLVAAAAPPERRTPFTRRRVFALLVPVAAAVAVAVVVTRPSHNAAAPSPLTLEKTSSSQAQGRAEALPATVPGAVVPSTGGGALHAGTPVAPSPTRAQRYSASLTLRVASPNAVSETTRRAVAAVTSLGGYVVSAHVDAAGGSGRADLVLKVPKANVRSAVARLSALGTITAEQVDIQDLQAGVNATDRTIQRLQRQLQELRSRQPTPAVTRQIATITARIQKLQRTEAATLRAARYATVELHVTTPSPTPRQHHGPGPLHGLGVAFRWIGIGGVYALALGLPALALIGLGWLAVRAIRRRREAGLLSRP